MVLGYNVKISKRLVVLFVSLFAALVLALIIVLICFLGNDTNKGGNSRRRLADENIEITLVPFSEADVTDERLETAKEVIVRRLSLLGIDDCDVECDDNAIVIEIEEELNSEPEEVAEKLCETAKLTFRVGTETTDEEYEAVNLETGEILTKIRTVPSGFLILEGKDIKKAEYQMQIQVDGTYEPAVVVEFSDRAAEDFEVATSEMAGTGECISIWLDNELISAPTVNEAITDGIAIISGNLTADEAKELADKINTGTLPFDMAIESID